MLFHELSCWKSSASEKRRWYVTVSVFPDERFIHQKINMYQLPSMI